MEKVQRKLAAIVAADVVGYSRLMGQDEGATLARLKRVRREIVHPAVTRHGGTVVKTTGDGWLLEFPSAVEAVEFAVELQREIAEQDAERRLQLRIGINVGDIIVEEDGDIYGDGVNVAARIEALANPGGVFISRSVRDQIRDKLPYTLEDRGEHEVKNIARPVRVFAVQPPSSAPAAEISPAAPLALPDKPSIAVLPFTNMSGDPEQEYFADGICEEIITSLSRVRWFFVIARNSSFTYKGRAVDVKQVGRELGVRYVLEGSVRKSGSRVRITGQLIDAVTGHHLWADRYDGELSDIFDLQDRVTTNVVGAIEPTLRQAEIDRSRSKPTENLRAYDLYLRALPFFYAMTREANAQSRKLLVEALALDSRFAAAKSLLATTILICVTHGWADDIPTMEREGVSMAREAIADAGDDPTILAMAALALGHLGRDYDGALVAIDRALALSPHTAYVLNPAAYIHLWIGEAKQAVKEFKEALRISPVDPLAGAIIVGIALAHLMDGDLEAALPEAQRAVRMSPYFLPGYRGLAVTLVRMQREAEAREVIARLRQISPNYSIEMWRQTIPFREREFREMMVDALRRAGLPER